MPHRGPVPLVGAFSPPARRSYGTPHETTPRSTSHFSRELRDAIDGLVRAVTWLHAGALKRLDLDREGDLVRGADRLVRVVSTEGEQALIYLTQRMNTVRSNVRSLLCEVTCLLGEEAHAVGFFACRECACLSNSEGLLFTRVSALCCLFLVICTGLCPHLPLHATLR